MMLGMAGLVREAEGPFQPISNTLPRPVGLITTQPQPHLIIILCCLSSLKMVLNSVKFGYHCQPGSQTLTSPTRLQELSLPPPPLRWHRTSKIEATSHIKPATFLRVTCVAPTPRWSPPSQCQQATNPALRHFHCGFYPVLTVRQRCTVT